MKKGDKVRFLSETGGGIVTGFQGKNIVLVQDSDGFEIPMSINEVVVVDEELDRKQGRTSKVTNEQKTNTTQQDTPGKQSIKALLSGGYENEETDNETGHETDPADSEITFRKPVEERVGGNSLNVYLAFVPENARQLSHTKMAVELVNDSNYYLRYAFATAEGESWTLRNEGEIEPNTKVTLETIAAEDYNSFEQSAFQAIAFKRQKSYVRKPAIDVKLHIEPLKLFKQHLFAETPFYNEPAMLYTIVEGDEAAETPVSEIDADKLKTEMLSKAAIQKMKQDARSAKGVVSATGKHAHGGRKTNEPLVVDLHAHEILETTQGMDSLDILQYQLEVFRRTLKEHANERGLKIVFIHGKGEGVLRKAIINELNRHFKGYTYQDASFQEYGYGATLVKVKG